MERFQRRDFYLGNGVLLIQENRLSGILLAHRMPLTELPGGKI
jgi:hypothetical protein